MNINPGTINSLIADYNRRIEGFKEKIGGYETCVQTDNQCIEHLQREIQTFEHLIRHCEDTLSKME